MNLYFILHVCRIHNSNLSEKNILLCIQNNMGSQVRDSSDSATIGSSWPEASTQPQALTGQHQLVPHFDDINIK